MRFRSLSNILITILFFLLMYLYFFSEMNSFFSQDDFFHLRTVMDKGFLDIPSFFYKLSNEYAFYRPLSREFYSLVALNIFGLDPLPYHLINLLLILMNGFLGIKFFKTLGNHFDNLIFKGIFLFLYLFSSIHSVELYYLSSIQTLVAATFTILSLIFFVKNRFLSLVFFTLAVMSHETSFVFLPIAFCFSLLNFKGRLLQRIKLSIKGLLPFILVFLIRIFIHFYGFGIDHSSTYILSFSPRNILNTSIWYLLWSFGLPEMLVDFATLRFQFNPNLFKYYGEFTRIVFPILLLLVSTLLVIIFKTKNIFIQKYFQFLIVAFLFTLLPLVFFPTHKFIYYLSFSIILFSGTISILFFEFLRRSKKLKVLVVIFLGLYVTISFQTLKINKSTYWAAKRAKSAQFIVKDIKNKFPSLQKGSVIFVKDDPNYPFIAKEWGTSSRQAFYILSGQDAFRLIFNDSTIKTLYQAFDGQVKSNINNLVIYEARFPY